MEKGCGDFWTLLNYLQPFIEKVCNLLILYFCLNLHFLIKFICFNFLEDEINCIPGLKNQDLMLYAVKFWPIKREK